MVSLPGPDQPDRRSRHKIKEIVVGLQDPQLPPQRLSSRSKDLKNYRHKDPKTR
jgi:hypothetical protein